MGVNITPNQNYGDLRWWCQKVLPLVYDESLSYYEVLCKLTQYIQELAVSLQGFQDMVDALGIRQDEVEQAFADLQNVVKDEIDKMWELLDAIKNGDYVDLYLDSIKNYIDQNLQNFVADIVKFVEFGISDDGHFVAYMPDNWDFLEFSTVPWDDPLEGHLVIEV